MHKAVTTPQNGGLNSAEVVCKSAIREGRCGGKVETFNDFRVRNTCGSARRFPARKIGNMI